MSNFVNTPGKGLLIAAGVILVVAGIMGAIGAYGLIQAAPLMRIVSPFLFGLSWSAIYRVLLISSLAYVGLGIEALIYCGRPDKAEMLKIQGYIYLGWIMFATIFITRHIGFSILSFLDFGLAIMYIAGSTMNANAPQSTPATPVAAFCSQCGYKLADVNNAAFCPGCGARIGAANNALQSNDPVDTSKNACGRCGKEVHDTDCGDCPHFWEETGDDKS